MATIGTFTWVQPLPRRMPKSKPAPDVNVLKKLKISAAEAVAIGDTPYDAIAAGKAGIATIGFSVVDLRKIRCGRPDVSRCFPGLPRCSPNLIIVCWRRSEMSRARSSS